MGIMVSKDMESNSDLSRRISSDLRTRTQSSEMQRDPDFAEDSAYIEDTTRTHKFGWVWIVLVVLAVISLVCIVVI